MHKYILIIGILFVSFSSCETAVKSPIGSEKMAIILADIHLAEAAAKTLTARQKDTLIAKYYEQIMDIHEVSKADFDSTLVVLKENPAEMLKVYEQVMEQIDKQKTAIAQ